MSKILIFTHKPCNGITLNTEERYAERKLAVDNLNFCVTGKRYFHAPVATQNFPASAVAEIS
jgi:hypothetical protein